MIKGLVFDNTVFLRATKKLLLPKDAIVSVNAAGEVFDNCEVLQDIYLPDNSQPINGIYHFTTKVGSFGPQNGSPIKAGPGSYDHLIITVTTKYVKEIYQVENGGGKAPL